MKTNKWEISIPSKKKKRSKSNKSQVIRISPEAYNALVEVYNESVLSISQVASTLILAASEHVIYEKGEEE